MTTRDDLEMTIAAARIKLGKIEDAERRKENIALLGKCFKYPKNCYSLPNKPSDYWPVYQKVTRVDSHGARAMQFETDSNGEIKIRFKTWSSMSGYVEIPKSEFDRAWRRVQKCVSAYKP